MRADSLMIAIAHHEAGYIVAATALPIELHPPTLSEGLRRCASQVVRRAVDLEDAALVMLIGGCALHRHDATITGAIDSREAKDLLYQRQLRLYGENLTAAHLVDQLRVSFAELSDAAEAFVDARWPEIEEAAHRLLAPSARRALIRQG